MRHVILVKHSLPAISTDAPSSAWPLSDGGRRRCRPLAQRLSAYLPFALTSSTERKAVETAREVADQLGLAFTCSDGLRENDRTGLPFVTREELNARMAALFDAPDALVIGRETANEARGRFMAAVDDEVGRHRGNVAIVAHGTVISLFAEARAGAEPFAFWRRLGLPSVVVLTTPGWRLVEVVASIA